MDIKKEERKNASWTPTGNVLLMHRGAKQDQFGKFQKGGQHKNSQIRKTFPKNGPCLTKADCAAKEIRLQTG